MLLNMGFVQRLLLLLFVLLSLIKGSLCEKALPSPQDIFTSAPFAQCHASTVVELTNGDWLAAWFGGSNEGDPDVAIWGARHTGSVWSVPFLLVREPKIASWNPVLFHTQDDQLWLYYKFGPEPSSWSGARMHSSDEGRTWSAPEHLPAGMLGPIRTKPLVLPDGTLVSGSSMESYLSWAVWIERSTDGGRNFAKYGPYTLDEDRVRALSTDTPTGKPLPVKTTGLIQPTVVLLGGQHLRFYARSSSNISRICISDSMDGGVTWSPPRPLDLPNPNSGIDIVPLADGRLVLIYNPVSQGRTPLALAVSADGLHFTNFRTLESEPNAEFSYPALIQLRSGDLLATYTWHRTRIRSVLIPLASVP